VEVAGIEEPGAESLADTGGGVGATAPVLREDSLAEREELLRERAQLLARVYRLEAELEGHRARSERTSKLLLSATGYAEWVRERARRDAEGALRKATARAQKLVQTTRDLEETQNELVRLKEELTRLRSLTDETRARLSAFLTAGLQAINAETEAASTNDPDRAPGHLDDTLRRQLPSALFTVQRQTPPMSASEPVMRDQAEPNEQ
jgi:cell division septum initiation protein DivIVA